MPGGGVVPRTAWRRDARRALSGGLRSGGMECGVFGRLRETTAGGFLSQTLTFPGMEQMGLRKFRGKACGRGRMWFREFPFILQRLRLTASGRLRSRLTARPPFTGSDISSPPRRRFASRGMFTYKLHAQQQPPHIYLQTKH